MSNFKIPRVLVLLATYNGDKYIDEQIRSILNQLNVNVKLLIRDDGSTDNTIEICRSFCSNPAVRLIDFEKSTGTPAGCFYKLISAVKDDVDFDYIAFSDQDDIWCNNKLNEAVSKMNNFFDGYSSNLIAFDSINSKTWVVNKSHSQTRYDYIFQGASAGCTYVLSRKAFVKIQKKIDCSNLDQLKKLSHDWLIYAIVRSSGMKWINDSSAYIFYRQHEKNSYGDKRGLNLLIKKTKLILAGWYESQINLIINNIENNEDVLRVKLRIIDGGIVSRVINSVVLLKSRRRLKESLIVIFIIFAKII